MSKKISQETFDSVLKENIEDFQMSPEEAVQDAVQQFSIQGVDLSNIVTVPSLAEDGSCIERAFIVAARHLTDNLSSSPDKNVVMSQLGMISQECKKEKTNKKLALTCNLYSSLKECWYKYNSDMEVIKLVIEVLEGVCNGQPKLIDNDGIEYVTKLLDVFAVNDCVPLIRLIQYCCTKNEANRQKFVGIDLIPRLFGWLGRDECDAVILLEVCRVFRALVKDDDMDVPYGKAHEHAQFIVKDHGGLKVLLDLTKVYLHNSEVTAELLLTLSVLTVRNEYCEEIMDHGGLGIVMNALNQFPDDETVSKHALAVLRAVSGNDKVKREVVKVGGGYSIIATMKQHQTSSAVLETGFLAIAALTLRCPENSISVMESGIADVIVDAMKIHSDISSVQKTASFAVRNIVSRNQEAVNSFIELGIEELLNTALKSYPQCEDAAKAALRDLGCDVKLVELWTGKGEGKVLR